MPQTSDYFQVYVTKLGIFNMVSFGPHSMYKNVHKLYKTNHEIQSFLLYVIYSDESHLCSLFGSPSASTEWLLCSHGVSKVPAQCVFVCVCVLQIVAGGSFTMASERNPSRLLVFSQQADLKAIFFNTHIYYLCLQQ